MPVTSRLNNRMSVLVWFHPEFTMPLSAKVKKRLPTLPDKPGVYFMRDQSGKIIYVGKAASLRSRVRNYFQPSTLHNAPPKLRSLINSIDDFDFIVVRSDADAVITEGRCEAVDALASPLPAILIGDKLGFPREMWPKLREWSEVTMYESAQNPPDGSPQPVSERSQAAIMEFSMATLDLIAQRRAEPRDDLLSIWCHTEQGGRKWTDAEIISECLLVLDGGAETTRTVIGSIIRELALQSEQRDLLVERPEILGETGVEEFIRWVTPILNMRRTVTADHEFRGKELRKGDQILLMYASANRDERVFVDPDRFDVRRNPNNHVGFGFGTHFCLGSSLARIEIRVMFEELLRRLPDWRLAPDARPQILGATFTRAYDAVEIEFTPGPRSS